ncbi:MAG: histidine kinase dimerization/phospho-acceptor domain-containing protein, partial [bacterium]
MEEQATSTSSNEHQSGEFKAATVALEGLRRALESDAPGQSFDHTALAQKVLTDVQSVRAVADSAVLAAQGEARAIERSTLEAVLLTGLLTAAICATVAILANRAVLRSLRTLHKSIVARADGPRPVRRADVGVVVSEIDALSERMHRELQDKNRELLRRERVAGIGLLAADVAHELRNPLNAMLGLTELSLRTASQGPLDGERRAEVQESLGVVRREIVRCREIVDRLMAMVRTRSAPTRFDANALLAESVQVARAARPDKAGCFHLLRTGVPLWTTAPAQEIRQILLTLLINAADAVKD